MSGAHKLFLILSAIMFASSLNAQDYCVFRPYFVPSENNTQNNSNFNSNTHFDLQADIVRYNEDTINVKKIETTPFENKDDLLRIIACRYDFFSTSQNIQGEVLHYTFEENVADIGIEMTLIYFFEAGYDQFFMFTEDGLFQFGNSNQFIDCVAPVFNTSIIDREEIQYVTELNKGILNVVEAPQFDTTAEQILFKDYYVVLKEHKAVYDTMYHLIYQESSNCEAAMFDTTYMQLIAKESANRFSITPAQFETLPQSILVRHAYKGEGYYTRQKEENLTIYLRTEYDTLKINGITESCDLEGHNFFDCLDFEFVNTPAVDTVLENVYELCQEGYVSIGPHCYSPEGEVPAIYRSFEREALKIPAAAIAIEIPAEYKTHRIVSILNKELIDSTCIHVEVDSVPYLVVKTPAFIEEINVPAEYKTVYKEQLVSDGEFEVSYSGIEKIISITQTSGGSTFLENKELRCAHLDYDCIFSAIGFALFEKGYLDGPTYESKAELYKAALAFQRDNNLDIGHMDLRFYQNLRPQIGRR